VHTTPAAYVRGAAQRVCAFRYALHVRVPPEIVLSNTDHCMRAPCRMHIPMCLICTCTHTGSMCEGTEKILHDNKPRVNGHKAKNSEPELSWFATWTTCFGYAMLVCIGHLRDYVGRWGNARMKGEKTDPSVFLLWCTSQNRGIFEIHIGRAAQGNAPHLFACEHVCLLTTSQALMDDRCRVTLLCLSHGITSSPGVCTIVSKIAGTDQYARTQVRTFK
jgi:hypothetical protein